MAVTSQDDHKNVHGNTQEHVRQVNGELYFHTHMRDDIISPMWVENLLHDNTVLKLLEEAAQGIEAVETFLSTGAEQQR